ncbi:MAG: HIT domain-containing protein [Patescibacteria group bacterium]
MSDCIFCQISSKEKEADIIFEDDRVVVFKDIKPSAKVHLLVVPKKHIQSIKDINEPDCELMGELIFTAKKIAEEQGLAGYKLLFNVGRDGGQIVDHIHMHLLAN